jgi:hypothetical protein
MNIIIGIIIGLVMGYASGNHGASSKYTEGYADGLAYARQKQNMEAVKNNACVLWWTMSDGRTLAEAKRAICGAK